MTFDMDGALPIAYAYDSYANLRPDPPHRASTAPAPAPTAQRAAALLEVMVQMALSYQHLPSVLEVVRFREVRDRIVQAFGVEAAINALVVPGYTPAPEDKADAEALEAKRQKQLQIGGAVQSQSGAAESKLLPPIGGSSDDLVTAVNTIIVCAGRIYNSAQQPLTLSCERLGLILHHIVTEGSAQAVKQWSQLLCAPWNTPYVSAAVMKVLGCALLRAARIALFGHQPNAGYTQVWFCAALCCARALLCPCAAVPCCAAAPCCAVLIRCCVLCCAVLCCAVLCCAVLCCAVLCPCAAVPVRCALLIRCCVVCCAVLCRMCAGFLHSVCANVPENVYQRSVVSRQTHRCAGAPALCLRGEHHRLCGCL
jgi:hypothetical protein